MNIILFLLVAANLIGVAVGMIFYYPQMADANPVFWIFIPDCPLYVLLAAFFYLGLVKNELLKTITAIGLMKYGLWTLFALFHYSGYFLSNFMGWLLVVEHIGMVLQSALFAKAFDKKLVLVALGWFLLNDFVDYALGMHPFLPTNEFGVVIAFTVAGSLILPVFAYAYGEKIGKNGMVKNTKALLGL